ncbi:MAG: hypothetical protein QM820_05525 [Minicystis sp.]
MATPQEHPNFRDVRHVRTLGPTRDEAYADRVVNDLLLLGWVLLHVSGTEGGPVFVLGWTKEGDAPPSRFDRPKDEATDW